MKSLKMTIGQPLEGGIPTITRRKAQPTRAQIVKRAVAKLPDGAALPIYTKSSYSANSLASVLRKERQADQWIVATRQHVVYVQRKPTATTGPVLTMTLADPDPIEA
ncbi:MAG: hypothetical protein EBS05_23755 [Proteobacteria bacterium]|nr:hypothetical protein [Pseudomonadota bacterium]